MRTAPLWVLTIAASCAWEAPINDNPLSAPPLLNAFEGTLVYGGTGSPSSSFITVFDATNPGPPVGTGSPVTFASVAQRSFTGEGAGVQSADYAVTQLPDGDYLAGALVDHDGDFNAFVGVLAGATCGDWVGGHAVDLQTGVSAPVSLGGGVLKNNVTIVADRELTTERPAFVFPEPVELSLELATSPLPPSYRVETTGISSPFSEDLSVDLGPACEPDPATSAVCVALGNCTCDPVTLDPCGTALWVWMVDEDLDGQVDPYPADLQAAAGLLDVWPRVFVEYVGEELGTFEHEGQELPERWVGENYPLAKEITITTLGGGSADDIGPVGVPFPVHDLSVTFSPAFRHYHADGTFDVDANGPYDLVDLREPEFDVDDVPHGAWSATLISFTGQTWALPNEIAALGLPGAGDFDPSSQGVTLTFVP